MKPLSRFSTYIHLVCCVACLVPSGLFSALWRATPVATEKGAVAMHDVQTGSRLATHTGAWQPVTYTGLQKRSSGYALFGEDGTRLYATPLQRFYSNTRRAWVQAKEIVPGEALATRTGGDWHVGECTRCDTCFVSCDVAVAHDHTFYAGEAEVLAHNAAICVVIAFGGGSCVVESAPVAYVLGAFVGSCMLERAFYKLTGKKLSTQVKANEKGHVAMSLEDVPGVEMTLREGEDEQHHDEVPCGTISVGNEASGVSDVFGHAPRPLLQDGDDDHDSCYVRAEGSAVGASTKMPSCPCQCGGTNISCLCTAPCESCWCAKRFVDDSDERPDKDNRSHEDHYRGSCENDQEHQRSDAREATRSEDQERQPEQQNEHHRRGRFTQEQLERAYEHAIEGNKLEHTVRAEKHQLGRLVSQFKEKGLVWEVIKAIDAVEDLPLDERNVFEGLIVEIGGEEVHVYGRIVDGIPRIGTFYVPWS